MLQNIDKSHGETKNNMKYAEVVISNFFGQNITVSFSYSKNVWIRYDKDNYNDDDYENGCDVKSCYTNPMTLYKKIPARMFNLHDELIGLCKFFNIEEIETKYLNEILEAVRGFKRNT